MSKSDSRVVKPLATRKVRAP